MTSIACFCGLHFMAIYGPAICPRCGRPDPLEETKDREESQED